MTIRLGVLALVCMVLVALTSGARSDTAPSIESVPHPDLAEFKPEIRQMLGSARNNFERAAASATGKPLGIAYGRLGLHYFAHELQDAARICFTNAAGLDPANYRWPYYLAVHYDETGQFEAAVAWYEKTLAIDPRHLAALTRIGLAMLEIERYDEARTFLARALGLDPDNAAAEAGMARYAESKGNFANARNRYLRALRLDPEASQLRYRLGLVYRELGDMDSAREQLDQRGLRVPSIEDPDLRFMNAHSRPAGYYVAVGHNALARNDIDRAWRLFDLAMAIDPNSADALVGLARVSLVRNQPDAARALAIRAQAIDKDHAGSAQIRGMLKEQDGRLGEAISEYELALRSRPDFHDARLLLANAQMRAGNYDGAAANYLRLAADAGDKQGHFRAGLALIGAARCNEAADRLELAMQDLPGDPRVILALARVHSTCAAGNDDDRAGALRFAEALYNAVPNLETSETLAMALAANGRFEDAVDYQTQAIFEAVKTGVIDSNPQLAANLDRYKESTVAPLAWPPGHQVFFVQPLRASSSPDTP